MEGKRGHFQACGEYVKEMLNLFRSLNGYAGHVIKLRIIKETEYLEYGG